MTYSESLEYLLKIPMFQQVGAEAFKPGLDTITELCRRLGEPQKRFTVIHIAGTNGKGSASHLLSSVLQSSGYKTGLYTSPHLHDVCERVRINGISISHDNFAEFITTAYPYIEELKPSFFEVTTAMAFYFFAKLGVDIAVIETGLGGRLDATNIVSPILSIITNISFDHKAILGDTIDKIAVEKAGIIKEGVPVVIGESDAMTAPIFIDTAHERHAPLRFADKIFRCSASQVAAGRQTFLLDSLLDGYEFTIHSDLMGVYQQKNIVTVLAALETLGERSDINISRKNIEEGFAKCAETTGLCGRWQTLSEKPRIICDTGHNEAGIREISQQLSQTPYRKLYIILGMVSDKDISTCLSLLPKDAYYIFTRSSVARALPAETLQAEGVKYDLDGETAVDVPSAISLARSMSHPDDLIFIGGSTFTVADIPSF